MRRLLVLGVILLAIGAALFFGYALGSPKYTPISLAQRALAKIGAPFGLGTDQFPVTEHLYETTFLSLHGESIKLAAERPGAGGGLTAFWDEVLLLTHAGTIYSTTGPDSVKKLPIEVPDNGFEGYRRLSADPAMSEFTFDLTYFRYNDILHFDSPRGQGLAISYTEFSDDEACYRNTIAVLDLDPTARSSRLVAATADDWRVVFRSKPCLPLKKRGRAIEGHMAGGRMAFEAPSTIYLASGDYHWDGVMADEAIAQRADWDYGKVIAVDVFEGDVRTISRGHRNTQGITIDSVGQIWVVEHGPRGGDELNLVLQDGDYGWPSETLGTDYNRLPIPNTLSFGRHDTFLAPTFSWLPSVATSGLTLVRGMHEAWDGDMIMATLGDRSLYRLRIVDRRVLFAERIHIGERVRYVQQDNSGRLVLWTDSRELLFLTAIERSAEYAQLERIIEGAGYSRRQANSVKDAMYGCMQCHDLVRDVHRNAPSLGAVYGRSIAGTTFEGYSSALRGHAGKWTRENLLDYLDDPQDFAAGTTMPDPGLSDSFVLGAIVDTLAALKDGNQNGAGLPAMDR